MQRTRPQEEPPTTPSTMVGPAPNLKDACKSGKLHVLTFCSHLAIFCRLLGDVCFLIQVVIRQPLPSLSGDYVMQRDRAEAESFKFVGHTNIICMSIALQAEYFYVLSCLASKFGNFCSAPSC